MPSVTTQLKDLADLLEKGLLTREEFDAQKRDLLGETTGAARAVSDPSMRRSVGAYRVLSVIGEGGMGAVYRGRHRSDTLAARQGGDVAIKVMHAQYARNPDYRERFEKEASLGLELDHPGIVKVLDLVVDGGELALVMELVEGQPLGVAIGEAVSPIPWERAWPLMQQLLDAVGYAHERGVVHRDLKPDNVLITADGTPHVIDFGIAKDLDAAGTRTGTGMGTVEYMAPEQYTDAKAVDRRADVYSLGMILYEMLAGRLPWEASASQFSIQEQKARKQLMSPSAFCSDIPSEIVSALSPALAADPDGRYGSTGAFVQALGGAGQQVASREESERRRAAAEREQRIVAAKHVGAAVPERTGVREGEFQQAPEAGAAPDEITLPEPLAAPEKRDPGGFGVSFALLLGVGGLVIVGLALFIIVGAVLFTAPGSPILSDAPLSPAVESSAEQPTEAREPPSILFVSRPSDAKVYIDGVKVGQTPYRFSAGMVDEEVEVKLRLDGYEDTTLSAVFPLWDEVRVEKELVSAATEPPVLVFTSTPSRADLYMDGVKVGRTPYRFEDGVPGREYSVTLRKDGYDDTVVAEVFPRDGTEYVRGSLSEVEREVVTLAEEEPAASDSALPEYTDVLAPSIIEALVGSNAAVKRCFAEGRARDEDVMGKIWVKFTVSPSGEVSRAHIVTADYAGTELDTCVSSMINLIQFTPFRGNSSKVVKYPFLVRP